MKITTRCSFAVLAIAVIFALASFFTPASAHAACATIAITNNSTCTVDITFYNPTAAFTFTVTGITPGGPNAYPAPPFNPLGIVTAFGNFVTGSAACAGCVTLQVTASTSVCCASVCPNGPCALVINPVTCSSACP